VGSGVQSRRIYDSIGRVAKVQARLVQTFAKNKPSPVGSACMAIGAERAAQYAIDGESAVVKSKRLNRRQASGEMPCGLRRNLDDPALATVADGDPVRETDFVAAGHAVGNIGKRTGGSRLPLSGLMLP
jgi:hypothetical protein